MEIKKKNWNNILNNWIVSVSLVLATLLFSLCFITPRINASASVTQSQINSYNINFVAAKTKVRSASGMKKILLSEQKGSSTTAPEFYTYQYQYNNYTDTKLYYGTTGEIYSSLSSTNQIEQTLFTAFDNGNLTYDREYGYIPYGVNYYDNVDGEKELVFYDNADTGDYVLINNYNLSSDNFNVENFYLAFGSPYIDEKTTTPLASLRIEGKLYSGNRTHYLALNTPETSEIIKDENDDNKVNAYYWNQYFDLKNLQAYETNETGSSVYNIENQQGRYELTFYFIRYNESLEPVAETPEVFTYTFYLLDGEEYSNYPTINNADILADTLTTGSINEYFYNFNTETPSISYDPTKNNLSYTRTNNKLTQTITSNFVEKTYTIDGNKYPLGILTFYNGSKIFKEVYILTYYNDNNTLVEYLYLSVTNPTSVNVPTTYSAFQTAVNNGLINFEYKTTVVRDITTNSYTTTTYRTETFANYGLITNDTTDISTIVDEVTDTYTINIDNNNKYTFNGVDIATLGTAPVTDNLISSVSSSDGIILNKSDLTTDSSVNINTTKYYSLTSSEVNGKIVYTLQKNYVDKSTGTSTTTEITLSTDTIGEVSIKDPIDSNITIKYIVSEEKTITSIIFTILNEYAITIDNNTNLQLINHLINPEEIKLEYIYDFCVDDLGIYNFTYSYICSADNNKYFINSTSEATTTNYYSASTNYTIPTDYTVTISTEPISKEVSTSQQELNVMISGVIGEVTANQVTLNGIVYTYSPTDNTITVNGTAYALNSEVTTYPFDKEIATIFQVENIAGRYHLHIIYRVGTIDSTSTVTQSYITSLNGKENYRNYIDTITTTTYTLSVTSNDLPNTVIWDDFRNVLLAIESYSYNDTEKVYTQTVKSSSIEETTQGQDRLHIFGSVTYFNKTDINTDSGYAKLQQIDNRLNLNYVSDVTSLYIDTYGTARNISVNDASAGNFKNKIATLLNKNNIIITDVTPVLWNNFSTLRYDNKKSLSYVFRYTDYTFNSDGSINYGSEVYTSTYTKDIYCQFDGLYEIVVFYEYTNIPDNVTDKVYYQVFTFIIDNSSPALTIEVENEDGEYEALGLNKYTNKNVRLSWEVPTYFKNDIYIEISKSYYNTTNSTYNFNSYYKQNTITTLSGINDYVQKISAMGTYNRVIDSENGTTREYYYVDLKVQSGADSSYNINGNYKIIMHYNANGKSTFTEEFVIDKQDISGLNIQKVVKNNDGSYSVSKGEGFTSQIINADFTFRFDPKASGANIYVYYDKIDFISNTDYDQIISASNDLYGITTKFSVNGDKITTGTQYVYNYTHLDNYNSVETNNLLTSNNSSLFLFRLVDEAGNECRYIVFYDKTEPRFVMSPEPDSLTHYATDTTRLFWGDYKAIKVVTSNELTIDNINVKVDNYSKDTDEKLNLILRYINTNSFFNNLKVEKLISYDENGTPHEDYYILVPITETLIEDRTYNTYCSNTSNTNNYYFFPINPIEFEDTNGDKIFNDGEQETITLPTFNADGTVITSDGKIVKETYLVKEYTITTAKSLQNNQNVNRYINVTYYINDTDTNTIYGVFGDENDTDNTHTYMYNIYDKLSNKTSGAITVTTDLTETIALGLFDYSDNVSKATFLEEARTSYSASKLFISSKVGDEIPNYTLTYKHYAYDASLYTDYSVTGITLLNSENTATITNANETYLQLDMKHKTQTNVTKTIKIQLTDEDGNSYPINSYPYSLEGTAVVADNSGNPTDIYSAEGFSYLNTDLTRKYSLALNTTTDTNRQKVVTEEGLYIFKRTYTDENIDKSILGSDSRIIYKVYYVDRSGIINITTSSSVASKLYNIGSNIGFTLGSNYYNTNYQKNIDAKTIQNNQTAITSSTSNANYVSSDLFETNKIEVEFTLAYDKHNFEGFVNDYQLSYNNVINSSGLSDLEKENLKTLVENTLFNTGYFSSTIYKTELSINVGGNNTNGTTLIDEKANIYDQSAINSYLQGTPMINSNTRSNVFNFFYDAGSNYYIVNINDQSGYIKHNSDGTTEDNYLSNNLKITFDISHDAPTGELYGKYYGRHDYDNNSEIASNPSIPIENGDYAILSKYLQEGQLEPLSDSEQSIVHSINGDYVQLYSTNNETMIFTFTITEDEYQAQIDPNNIKIYKGSLDASSLIFNRVDGNNIDTSLVSATRQKNSFVKNVINGTTYYAIIIFDNNLDEILDDDEKTLYSDYRLLDAKDNPDKETYYIQINYVGDASDYVGEDALGNTLSFYNTTYEIIVDRIKPTYNLTKLMALDKYTYNTISTSATTSNYESLFEQYMSVYNFSYDTSHDFYRSDLENYFFALDYREDTTFKFESIDTLDNNKSLYIRLVDKNNYKFSVTPDDYKAYYNAVYLQGHPQFTPSNATVITNDTFGVNSTLALDKYYRVQFTLDGDGDDNSISAYYLKNRGIFKEDCYYEIIEEDATGNYRVYAVYIPHIENNKVVYTYQTNSSISSEQTVTILYDNTPYVESKGMELKFTNIQLKDNFLRANIEITTNKINHILDIILDPNNLTVTVTNRTTKTVMWEYSVGSKDKDGYANTDVFMEAINYTINYYNELINDKTHSYYSEYGYEVDIDIVDRIGISVKDMKVLYNYEIDYVVAGSTLSPIFIDNNANFTMRLEGQKGSTYLTDITVYKFNKTWTQINVDNSSNPKIFDLTDAELKNPIDYLFTRGVYKFVFTDNFNRVNEFFHEYGISSSQTGGSLTYTGEKSTLADGYTYSANQIEYSYDSSVYNVYIKFIGKIPDEFASGEYIKVEDAQNLIIYSSGSSYSDEYLRQYYGISIITSGNTTTITFHGVKDNSTISGTTDLSKYHIKTILASTSDNYTWGDEETNKNIFVYDKKIALYTAIQDINIRNLSGNTLDTTEHLNLTEDFELITSWKSSVSTSERNDFNSRIILTRTYNDNGTIRTSTSKVASGQVITLPGDYIAYVINDLGMTSRTILFTRGEGEISMYAVYAVDNNNNNNNNSEKKLTPSSLITNYEAENKVLFTYYITNDYFSYKDSYDGTIISMSNLIDYISDPEIANKVTINQSANRYLDVRVNSNLSIKTEVYEIGTINNFDYPYIQYRIYSDTKTGDIYTYRFIRIVFVNKNDTSFANVSAINSDDASNNLAEKSSVITSSSDSMYIEFTFNNEEGNLLTPIGNTLYVDRYYNGTFAETIVLSMSNETKIPVFSMNLTTVGLHEFVLRDLAGRVHLFNGSEKLQVYLINQILFTVNGENPINNQVFNGSVDIDIVYTLSGLQLYNERTLSITVTKNGTETNYDGSLITGAGYYTIKMSANTLLSGNASTQITSTYNFLIVDTQIANKSFSISKGSGFTIEKLVKIVGEDHQILTDTYETLLKNNAEKYGYEPSEILLWFSYAEHGNCIFDVTLKHYEEVTNSYRTFNFRIWINDESPIILSSIPEGTSTKETININYNLGLIYTQIGKGYITLNDEVIAEINENSQSIVDTLSISKKGTYWFRIYNEDGTLVSAYKFVKNDPLNNMTKIILICVALGVVLVVGLFFFIRRKGRYR